MAGGERLEGVMRKMEIAIAIAVCIILMLSICINAEEIKEPDAEPQYIQMEATAYCYGTTRCDGKAVRIGICFSECR